MPSSRAATFGRERCELIDDQSELRAGGGVVGLGEDRADQRRDHLALLMGCGSHHVAHRVHAAALPGGALELGADRSTQPGVGVGDHELDAGEAAVAEAAEELGPEHFGLGVADVDTEDFSVSVSTQPGGDHDSFGHDVAVLAHVDVGGVEPHVDERLMIQPSGAQDVDVGVDLFADACSPSTC